MQPATGDQIRRALRDRFEADRLLGATALPVRVPKRKAPPATAQAGTAVVVPRTFTTEETEQRRIQLAQIDDNEVKGCTQCGLSATRTKTVYGVGSPTARIAFVGEAPGHDEDVSGEPFVGRAGRLLTDMIQKGMGLRREDVYICNVLKCRPPENRNPSPDEVVACKDYLLRQLEIIQPELIIALGTPAVRTLLGTRDGIGRLRGRFHDFYPSGTPLEGNPIPLMATYHPAYLLRSPGEKKKVWADLKLVMARLGIPLPKRG